MINIPNDLRKNKDKIIGNMDLRECICVLLGLIIAIAFLYYFRIVLGFTRVIILAFFAGLIVIPFLFFGFKRIYGMKVDDYFKVFVNNNILSREVRINKYKPVDIVVKDKKYELIRYYKLKDKNEIIKLKEFLQNKGILYLTEYVSYKKEQYAIFRINCKSMELTQEKKIREAVGVKNKEKELRELKSIRKILKSKKYSTFKNEIDIFEEYGKHSAKRVDDIKLLKEIISADERNIYELNLYDKTKIKSFVYDKDKVVFISNDGKVDIFLYESKNILNEAKESIIDLLEVDKKHKLFESIKNLEARNSYNFYRKVNKIEEIL
ncbi:MAG: PrgI family protein [Eubacteriales bacterium]|nr:PrgI family protein [Eubacteriales bacterium]